MIVAAGAARRMGFDKILAPLAGKPVLAWSLEAFSNTPGLRELVVVCPPGREGEFREVCAGFSRVSAVAAGGRERADSVRAGLAALENCSGENLVAVHDAARPLIVPQVILQCLEAAARSGAAALAAPMDETLHEAGADGMIRATPPRERFWRAQTPQAARRGHLLRALETGSPTDDAGALAALGVPVRLVENPLPNLKITRPPDLVLAQAILEARQEGLA